MCGIEQHLQTTWATVQTNKSLYTLWQRKGVLEDEYFKLFNSHVTVLETFAGEFPLRPFLVTAKLKKMGICDPDNADADERAAAVSTVREEYLTCLCLSGADRERYSGLKEELANGSLFEKDLYPKSRESLLSMMTNFKCAPASIKTKHGRQNTTSIRNQRHSTNTNNTKETNKQT